MASKSPADIAAENGKPAKNSSPPVIRRLEYATEDGRSRLLKRQVPAWIISGLVHVILIAGYITIMSIVATDDVKADPDEKPITTKIEMAEDEKEDLTLTDPGLEADLASVEVDRQEDKLVDAKAVDGEPVGLPTQENDVSSVTQEMGPLVGDTGMVGSDRAGDDGLLKQGQGGAGAPIAAGDLAGRSGSTRDKYLRKYGGNPETERAVALGLAWLAKQQKTDGHWEFDGSKQDDHIAATGMALLPFLAAGETHLHGMKYKRTVSLGLDYLAKNMEPTGQFKGAGHYTQAVATIPICETGGMTQDPKYKKLAAIACKYIVDHQAENGSWGYHDKADGDTSIVGWQIQALQSGVRSKCAVVPDAVFKKADRFLESVASESGSQYGYKTAGSSNERLTAVGHLSRQYISNSWNPKNPALARGVKWMWDNHKPNVSDMYYTYYATQVFHWFDGPSWHRDWNPAMQKALLPTQKTEKTKGVKVGEIGSWNADRGIFGASCGKLGTTCLCVLTLEVFYRHLPIYKRTEAAGGVEVLEGNPKAKE